MSESSTSPTWPQLEPLEQAAPGDRLRVAVEEMQSIVASSTEQIAGLIKLGLIALETPPKASDREIHAQLLLAVLEKTQMMSDSVSYEAENLGIVHRDEAKERRAAAHRS